jgi:hypothetical protein
MGCFHQSLGTIEFKPWGCLHVPFGWLACQAYDGPKRSGDNDIRPVQKKGLMLFDPPSNRRTSSSSHIIFSRTPKVAATPDGIPTQPHHRAISLAMIPKTILFVIFMVISSVATGTYVVCAKNGCTANAAQIDSHSFPQEGKCGEPLGNEECQEERQKTYYLCDNCGSITVKNKVIHRGKLSPCFHKAKALFIPTPSNPPPPGAASHSRATSEATSSEGGLPYEIIDGRKFFKFV